MGILVLVAFVVLMSFAQRWVTIGRERDRSHPVTPIAARPSRPAPVPSAAALTDPAEIERTATARLLAGELDSGSYRVAMSALVVPAAESATVRTMLAERGNLPRFDELLGRLHSALPQVPPDTMSAAVNLARCGASVEDLVRLLHLTSPQALRITTALSGSDDLAG